MTEISAAATTENFLHPEVPVVVVVEPLPSNSFLDEDNSSAFLVETSLPEHYRCPLDTLLHLINSHKMSIYDIRISFILDRYLEEMDRIKRLNLRNVGEHFEMVAQLMQIKSKMLLPKDPTKPATVEDDPRAELVEQLLSHQRKMTLIARLREMQSRRATYFAREFEEIPEELLSEREVILNADLGDLCATVERMLEKVDGPTPISIRIDMIDLQERVTEVLEFFKIFPKGTFSDLTRHDQTRQEHVVTFLSVLELAKSQVVRMQQPEEFGEIFLERRVDDDEAPALQADEDDGWEQ